MSRICLPLFALVLLASIPDSHAEEAWNTTASGLKYQVVKQGEGASPERGDRVTVHYTGTLTNGTKFDSSRDRGQPFTFTLGMRQVIAGWDEGVALMKKGSRFTFHIPWKLAYGAHGKPPKIGPKADLIFDVELISFSSTLKFKRPDTAAAKTLEGGTRYEVLRAGSGATPRPDQGVALRLAAWNNKGAQIVTTDDPRIPLQGGLVKDLRLGQFEAPFLSRIVQTMRVGQKVAAEVPSKEGFGDKFPDPNLIPKGSATIWVLELMSINDIPEFVLPTDDQLSTTSSGLKYQMLEAGGGRTPGQQSVVEVHYTGWLTDGTMFDSSHARGTPTSFPVGRVIPGWTEGLKLMKEGGTARFVIPANLAYGNRAMGPVIKPGSTLVFLVKLIKIVR